MNEKFDRLKRVLYTIFQMDQADLDFGIYRIMNVKRDEIRAFLETDLRQMVQEELGKLGGGKREDIQVALDKATKQAKELGADPESLPRVRELRAELAKQVNTNDLENDIYSHLADFFSRYYQGGDFVSKRRYKDDVYAIPYQGEEVKLYWANHDQYYIKTTENFATYRFRLSNGSRVQFQIAEATTERDNNKSQNERYFMLLTDDDGMPDYSVDGNILMFRFVYQWREGKVKQADLNADAVKIILAALTKDTALQPFIGLAAKDPTEKDKDRTVLAKQLTTYTSKNTFDYFIHKDLRGFLTRELDFYIKNEILRVDDLDEEHMTAVIGKARAFKEIANALINLVSQLEEFQKKLWLKKKFVVSADYCMTLDHVDSQHYATIASNASQLEEWVKLGFIEDPTVVDVDYLDAHPYLLLDTAFFPELKYTLLARFDDLEEAIAGVLIHSENFQALNLLQERYREDVSGIYIDPPYNKDGDGFLYKDGYRHSSWLTQFRDRVSLGRQLLAEKGILTVSCDENELDNISLALSDLMYEVSKIVVLNNPKGRSQDKYFSTNHEYAIYFSRNQLEKGDLSVPKTAEELASDYPLADENGQYREIELRNTHREFGRHNRQNLWYPIYVDLNKDVLSLEPFEGSEPVYPYWDDGFEGCWTWGKPLTKLQIHLLTAKEARSGRISVYRKDYALNQDGSAKTKAYKTIWSDKSVHTEKGQAALDVLFGSNVFKSPKSVDFVKRVVQTAPCANIFLDFFAGSGTTGHSVIQLNREDDKKRRYILVEMGTYFDTVTKPRIQKFIYSDNWKDGKPQNTNGISQVFKYFKLESYEDTLNNLRLAPRSDTQQSLLDNNPALRRDYTLNYMLDVETRGSASLLDVEMFRNPFSYTMQILGNDNELIDSSVDLAETFNYLLGLHVRRVEMVRGIRVIQGNLVQTGERVLILWRDMDEIDNVKLNDFLRESAYSLGEFDIIYVNGDNHIESLKTGSEKWKVHLIETEFHARMFS